MHHSRVNKIFRYWFPFNFPMDNIMTMAKGPMNAQIDIVKFDELLAQHDSEYDNVLCQYKGKEVSCMEYVELKYGKDAVDFINKLLDS